MVGAVGPALNQPGPKEDRPRDLLCWLNVLVFAFLVVFPAVATHGALFIAFGFPSPTSVTSLGCQPPGTFREALKNTPVEPDDLYSVFFHAAYSDIVLELGRREPKGHKGGDVRSRVTDCSHGDVLTEDRELIHCTEAWEGHGLKFHSAHRGDGTVGHLHGRRGNVGEGSFRWWWRCSKASRKGIRNHLGNDWGRKRCPVENSWTARMDMVVGREEECCGRNGQLGRTDGVLALAQAGCGTRSRCTGTARPTGGEGEHMLQKRAMDLAAARYDRQCSHATGIWEAAAAFDASAVHHKDPSVVVWKLLNLIRPCI